MRAPFIGALAAVVAIGGLLAAQSGEKGSVVANSSDRERLIGAWRLASLGVEGADGKLNTVPGLKGTLIYTRDGRMSVQIMYPQSDARLSNDYVMNGYEASFGSYDVNEMTHTVTHHVEGANVRGLVGKHLPRLFRISRGQLLIRSTRPDEHWSVVWER
jgi:hypothetical protein